LFPMFLVLLLFLVFLYRRLNHALLFLCLFDGIGLDCGGAVSIWRSCCRSNRSSGPSCRCSQSAAGCWIKVRDISSLEYQSCSDSVVRLLCSCMSLCLYGERAVFSFICSYKGTVVQRGMTCNFARGTDIFSVSWYKM
jgi:hypothetical protein